MLVPEKPWCCSEASERQAGWVRGPLCALTDLNTVSKKLKKQVQARTGLIHSLNGHSLLRITAITTSGSRARGSRAQGARAPP